MPPPSPSAAGGGTGNRHAPGRGLGHPHPTPAGPAPQQAPARQRNRRRPSAVYDAGVLRRTLGFLLAFLLKIGLAELAARLDPTQFCQVHRSHVVNLEDIALLHPFDERRLLIKLREVRRRTET
jgi:hypothetical protein